LEGSFWKGKGKGFKERQPFPVLLKRPLLILLNLGTFGGGFPFPRRFFLKRGKIPTGFKKFLPRPLKKLG